MDETGAGGGERRLPIRFVGSGSEYFRIWIVNVLLTLLTLGIYYPYAKVRRLRYFNGATEVDGLPLSFHADPHKMLRGYLLVALMFAGYALAGRYSPSAGLVAFCIVAGVWPALWHSSLRFRLANTGWRGLRFRFTGTRALAYAALAPGLLLAAALVAVGALSVPSSGAPAQPVSPWFLLVALLPLLLLLALPWMLWLLRRYQHQHYALAAEQSRFAVKARQFYGLALRAFGLAVALAIVLAFSAALMAASSSGGTGAAAPGRPGGPATLLPLALMLLLLAGFQLVMRPYLTSRLQNLVWNGTRSEHFHFHSQLRLRPLLRLTAKNWVLMLLTLGLYFPFAVVATTRMRLEAVEVVARADPATLLAASAHVDEAAAGDAAGDLLGLDIGL